MTSAVPLLLQQIRLVGLPTPETEYRFHETRRWRFDVAFVPQKLAVEVDGGVFSGGRHLRGAGYRNDAVKLNEAICLGWRVLRVLPEHVQSGAAIAWVERVIPKGD